MNQVSSGARFGDPMRRNAAAERAAGWLNFAAAPVFALMALLTWLSPDASMSMICGPGLEPSWLAGMLPMYLLMSGFHLPPWLTLIAQRRRAQIDG